METEINKEDLPEGWKVKKLEEVCKDKPQSGGTPLTSIKEYYEKGDIPWVITADLTNAGMFIDSTSKKITKKGLENSSARWFPKGTILFAMYGSIGKMSITQIPLTTNQAILGIIPNDKEVEMKYLYYYLEYAKPKIIDAGRGGTQANVNAQIVKEFPVIFPPLQIQHKIVTKLDAFFSEYNAALKEHELVRARSEKILQAAISNLIPNPEEELPDGWIAEEFEKILELSPQNGLYKESKYFGSGVLFLDIKGLYSGLYASFNSLRRVKINDKEKKYLLQNGDICINRVSKKREGVGKSVLVSNLTEPCAFESNMMRIRTNQNIADSEFINYFLNSQYCRKYLVSIASTTNQTSINQKHLKSIMIPLPTIKVQKIIISKLNKIQEIIIDINKRARQNESAINLLPIAVLSKAFSGELVV